MEKETPQLKLLLDDAEAINELFRQALNQKGTKAFTDFLEFIRRFNRLSIFNAMLVHVQRPGAAAVGTRYQWKGIGRWIKPDAIPIVILRPFGPVQFVYEQSDTDGAPLPKDVADPFAVSGTVKPLLWDRTVTAAKKCRITVELADYGTALGGTAALMHNDGIIDVTSNKDTRWRIRINRQFEIPTKFAILSHELGHIYCGHLGGDEKGRWPNRQTLSKEAGELEAEATSFLVCSRARLTTNSVEYLRQYVAEDALKDVDVYMILGAANRIEARGD